MEQRLRARISSYDFVSGNAVSVASDRDHSIRRSGPIRAQFRMSRRGILFQFQQRRVKVRVGDGVGDSILSLYDAPDFKTTGKQAA
jgi:hypothetical protein